MPNQIELNPEICELIGAFIGDGYLGNYGKKKNQYVVGFAGDKSLDEDYLKNHLYGLIKRNFPLTTPRTYSRTDENTLMLRINSKEVHEFFSSLGFSNGKKAHIVKIPQPILANELFMNNALKGIFDTDGCVFLDKRKKYKKPYPRITLQVASIPLIEQVEEHLSKNFKIYVNKNNRDGYRNYLEIYGHKQVETFLKQIGFSNKRHLNKINASVA